MGVTKTRGASLIGFLSPWFSGWLIGAVLPSVTFHSVIPCCAEKGGKCSGTAAKAALSAPLCQPVWSELRFVQWLWWLHPPVGNPSSCGSLLWSPAHLLKDLSTSFFPEFTLPKPCTSKRWGSPWPATWKETQKVQYSQGNTNLSLYRYVLSPSPFIFPSRNYHFIEKNPFLFCVHAHNLYDRLRGCGHLMM